MRSDALTALLNENAADLAALEGNLLSAAGGTPVSTLLVSSAHPREGKTTSAVMLAASLAEQAEGEVLLIDACLRRPRLGRVFALGETTGLADWLRDESGLDTSVHAGPRDRLRVMPRGTGDAGGFNVSLARRFGERLGDLAKQFQYVVADTDATLGGSDAVLLAPHFDGVILTAACGRTDWGTIAGARRKIENVGGRVLGLTLNRRRRHLPRALYEAV